MRNAAQSKFVGQIVESVQVFDNKTKFPHQPRIFKIFFQSGIKFGHKKRVVIRQGGDKGRIDGKIIFRRMAGTTGSTVTVKGLVKKDLPALFDQLGIRIRSRRWRGHVAAGQQNQAADKHDYRFHVFLLSTSKV